MTLQIRPNWVVYKIKHSAIWARTRTICITISCGGQTSTLEPQIDAFPIHVVILPGCDDMLVKLDQQGTL